MNLALTLGRVEAELLRRCCNEKAQAQFIGGLSKGGGGQCPQVVPHLKLRSDAADSPQLLTTSLPAHIPPPEDYG